MDDDRIAKARHRLLAEIARDAEKTAHWTGRAGFSGRTMAAMAAVPRHRFVLPEHAAAAYANRPQRIGFGQTISQPYIVALMTDLLDLEGDEKILEIGAGSGYQAAVLASVLRRGQVFSLEAVAELAKAATARLRDEGYGNVTVRHGDGFAGWPEEAPFDAVIVTAAPMRLPDALVDQLAPGGRMVVPIGKPHDRQVLTLLRKDADGAVRRDEVLPVAFVPMVEQR